MHDKHLFTDAVLQLPPLPASRCLDVLEVTQLFLQGTRIMVTKQELVCLNLLFYRVFHDMVVCARALAQDLVDRFHIIAH